MTEMDVETDALESYAAGNRDLAEKFGDLADLLEQARVNDECFGPIGEMVGLANTYFTGLEESQQLANDAKDFLEQCAKALDMCVASYSGLEDGLTKGFRGIEEAFES